MEISIICTTKMYLLTVVSSTARKCKRKRATCLSIFHHGPQRLRCFLENTQRQLKVQNQVDKTSKNLKDSKLWHYRSEDVTAPGCGGLCSPASSSQTLPVWRSVPASVCLDRPEPEVQTDHKEQTLDLALPERDYRFNTKHTLLAHFERVQS